MVAACTLQERKSDDLEIIKRRGYLIVGVKDDSPPFGFYSDNELKGIDINIAKEIANDIIKPQDGTYEGGLIIDHDFIETKSKRAHFKKGEKTNIKLVRVNTRNRIEMLNARTVDILVATMSINSKRRLIVSFSNPYFIASQKLMVNKDSRITHLKYFNKNGKLAVVVGTTGEKILHLAAPNARVVGVDSYPEAIELLKNKLVDGVIGDDCILEGYNKENEFKIVNRAYSREFYGVATRKTQNSQKLLDSVNSTIARLLDEKTILLTKKRALKEPPQNPDEIEQDPLSVEEVSKDDKKDKEVKEIKEENNIESIELENTSDMKEIKQDDLENSEVKLKEKINGEKSE